jgi:hypothetical protein
MEGRMDDGMDHGTDGWKGPPPPTTTGQNLKYYISRLNKTFDVLNMYLVMSKN